MKRNKGITLIALIITIIVMVILAGVIIVSAVADGGIIDRAQTALKVQEAADVEEIVIGSYVYKITASTTRVAGKLDLPKTAIAIYQNLTENGFTVLEKTTIDGKTAVKMNGDTEINLSVEGKHGEYEGKVDSRGLKESIKLVEKNDDNNNDKDDDIIDDDVIQNDNWYYEEKEDGTIKIISPKKVKYFDMASDKFYEVWFEKFVENWEKYPTEEKNEIEETVRLEIENITDAETFKTVMLSEDEAYASVQEIIFNIANPEIFVLTIFERIELFENGTIKEISQLSEKDGYNLEIEENIELEEPMYYIDYNIPSEIDGKKVTEIGEKALYFNNVLYENITIPENIEKIGEYAFYGITILTESESFVIPNSVKEIGERAFRRISGIGINEYDEKKDEYIRKCRLVMEDKNGILEFIGDGAFEESCFYGNIKIRNSVNVASNAFSNTEIEIENID